MAVTGLLSFGSADALIAAPYATNISALQDIPGKDLIGRWDITVDENGKSAPSWLEVKLSGNRTLVGYFVAASGSARPVSEVKFQNGKFSFRIPPQWESGNQDFVIEGELKAGGIEGSMLTSEGKKYSWKG